MSQETTLPAGTAPKRAAGTGCPLSRVPPGTAVKIKQLLATPDMCHRLREMGFCEEQRIKLLLQHDNVVCQVCNVRLGISAELADSIVVEPLAAQKCAA